MNCVQSKFSVSFHPHFANKNVPLSGQKSLRLRLTLQHLGRVVGLWVQGLLLPPDFLVQLVGQRVRCERFGVGFELGWGCIECVQLVGIRLKANDESRKLTESQKCLFGWLLNRSSPGGMIHVDSVFFEPRRQIIDLLDVCGFPTRFMNTSVKCI